MFLLEQFTNGQDDGTERPRSGEHTAIPTINSLSIDEADGLPGTFRMSSHEDEQENQSNQNILSSEDTTQSASLNREINNTPDSSPSSINEMESRDPESQQENNFSESSPQPENDTVLQDEQILNFISGYSNRPSKIHTIIVLIACMFLFRLFLEGLANGDVRMLLAVLLSIWLLRWVQLRRMERYDEEFAGVLGEVLESGDRSRLGATIDVQLLGFQGQLAMAILESRRQMNETGGYGRPDGAGNILNGVSEETKAGWKHFHFNPTGNVDEEQNDSDDMLLKRSDCDSVCCICLGEYEKGEFLCELPCGHLFHKECIGDWCENHQRCPLCNINLEEFRKEQDKISGSCINPVNESMV